ncbi:alpha/beta fold hydrolase [Streptomyces sp. UH6]|uniref:alpha/beta fold hydrolase n=1 Tax=Streptomyces sp. UH6 TaxID=2748379 RepID=UPI0015D4A2D8|nr:alpha/beta hydrolase [Streptomyces sp. UH6]NYV76354.1 alpha/beta hydrolase [Streptomyces sp. UH6]
MSRPDTFTPPPGARVHQLATGRGAFAAMEMPAAPGVPHRGTALLLPGYTGSKEDFIALHTPLAARGYRTVAVDGRGQYESDGPERDESAYAQDELAQDLLSLAQVLAEAEGTRIHLLGHSLGGQISRATVLRDASPFLSLTLMSSGPARISDSQQERVTMLREALGIMSMDRVWAVMQAMEATAAPEELAEQPDTRPLRERWLRTRPAQLIATGRQLCTEPDRVDELAAVNLPYHVLSGSHDDAWPVELLDEMAVRLGALRTVIDGADHSPAVDRPAATAEALAGFWDGVGRQA